MNFDVLPSTANFVLARHTQRPAEDLALLLREQGIIVRHFSKPRIDQYLRVTIGTEDQNNLLIDNLQKILQI
jgi:histidinol-phosphate aminotransferase